MPDLDSTIGAAERVTRLLSDYGLLGAVVVQSFIIGMLLLVVLKIRADQMKDYGVFGEKLVDSEREHRATALMVADVAKGLISLSSAKGLRDAARNAAKSESGGGSSHPPRAANSGGGSEGNED